MQRRRARPGVRSRAALFALALLGHLAGALGCPVPARSARGDRQPFPCQSRPCGCASAEECWKGDCCCFTLEEKLAWAEENGVEPPAHVRPLVEARRAASPPCPQGCCTHCAEPAGECCRKQPATTPVEVRWVAGVFARKCRGEGPAGTFRLDPSLAPDALPLALRAPETTQLLCPISDQAPTASRCPPTPPPRRS
ncbi:MAG: hypothetical protein U0797_03760 [Gemmataceae bacterium]